jgi:hypothetical protein
MLKLTDEQLDQISQLWWKTENTEPMYRAEVKAITNAVLAMLNASPTHRVVEAPEGYEFDGIPEHRQPDLGHPDYLRVILKPIPKPCPAPVLEPVTVTVESVYGKRPPIPEGFEAFFGTREFLESKGCTHFISKGALNTVEWMPAGLETCRIGLRKWEPK